MKLHIRSWRGIIIGALLGSTDLLYNGEFKGNLGESEFLASYIGYLLVPVTIGYFVENRRLKRKSLDKNRKKPYLFVSFCLLLLFIIISKIIIDFPNGEGLFHPTRDSLNKSVNKICISKFIKNDNAHSTIAEEFCKCWTEVIVDAATAKPQKPAREAALQANAKCGL